MDDVTTARQSGRESAAAAARPTCSTTLRQEIIALTLAPGAVLSRAELQDRFGLSSTPVRDALMRLQEEGLVDVFPQHATVVSAIDLRRRVRDNSCAAQSSSRSCAHWRSSRTPSSSSGSTA